MNELILQLITVAVVANIVLIVAAIVLQWLLSSKLALPPKYLLPALEVALLIGLTVANPVRMERRSASMTASASFWIAERFVPFSGMICAAAALASQDPLRISFTSALDTVRGPVGDPAASPP